MDKYVIQTREEPTLFVATVTPNGGYLEPNLTNDAADAMEFGTLQDAQAIINQFLEPANWVGARPPHKPPVHK